jgi:hypothetical protein
MGRSALLFLLWSSAWAYDLRLLVGTDFFLTTAAKPEACPDPQFYDTTDCGKTDLTNAELGITARIDLRDVAKRWDFKLDFMGREGFIGNSSWNQLIELSASVRLASDRVKISIGRMKTPGGFWLIVDGLKLDVKYTSWLGQSAWGGIRSYTTGRRDTWMGPEDAVVLPLVGTSLWVAHRLVDAQLSFSWSRDAIDLRLGRVGGRGALERHVEDEYFLDGYVSLYPVDKLSLSAGFSLGSRYDVQFDAMNPFGPTTLGIATIGAVGAYGTVEYRPLKPLRLLYTFNYERVRLIESQLLLTTAAGAPVQAAAGSFQDHALKISYRIWRALKAEARYRLRYRENTDLEHHVLVGLWGDELWKGIGANLSVGVDIDTLAAKEHDRVIYNAGLSYLRPHLDLALGITFTDGIGSGLPFSHHQNTGGAAPTQLFPYVLEANRIVYLRAFGTFWKMFAGLDLEENLDSAQIRMLLQIGGAL